MKHKLTYACVLLCCRQECKKLREELREEHEEDKASALAQLAQSKDQELSNARESWQRKVEDLLEQVQLSPMGVYTVQVYVLNVWVLSSLPFFRSCLGY